MMRACTECFLLRDEPRREVLLGYKKIGFGAGKYAGIGGKVNPGEAVIDAAVRELEEEIGVRVDVAWLEPVAELTFTFPARPSWNQVAHVFLATKWEGEPSEGDEMVPSWHSVGALPLDRMWSDTAEWLPRVLAGHATIARFIYAPDNESVHEMIFDK